MIATAAVACRQQGFKVFGGGLKSCKLRMRVKFNILVIYSVGFLHLQLIHILALSPQVTVYSAWVLAKHIQVWNQDSLSYGMESGWCRLHCKPYSGAVTITGVVVRGFRSSSVPVTHKGYLVESRRPLWFGSSQANRSAFNTLSRHSPLAGVSRSTPIISLRLGSSASLS